MTSTPGRTTPSARLATLLRALLLIAAGAGLATLVLLDPFGLPLPWSRRVAETGGGAAAPAQLWTCGMHPQVIQDHPGTCPICHMALTPVSAPAPPPAAAPAPAAPAQLWTCGMHPQVIQDHPGTCPICHMALTPLDAPAAPAATADSGRDAGPEVAVEAGLLQRMNVTTTRVERGDLERRVTTVGTLEYDHELETTVTVKFRGFVEHVHVHLLGERVRQGQPLFDVYSPELVQTQQDLLSALQYARRMEESPSTSDEARRRARDLVEAARERLRLWDISAAQVRRIEKDGKVMRVLTVSAPASGVITQLLPGLAGMEVSPGMGIATITDVSRTWVTARLYEDQVAAVAGQRHAWVSFDAHPGERLRAEVLAIRPTVDAQTRTVELTLALDNPGGRFRQGMYAHVEFEPVVAEDVLIVPAQAVLRTGTRTVAVVAKGGGRFAPREVVIGEEADGRLEIREGLSEGEEIVTSAQFLIDSESNLRAAVQAMIAGAAR